MQLWEEIAFLRATSVVELPVAIESVARLELYSSKIIFYTCCYHVSDDIVKRRNRRVNDSLKIS